MNFEPADAGLIVVDRERSSEYWIVVRNEPEITIRQVLQAKTACDVFVRQPPVHGIGKVFEVSKEAPVNIARSKLPFASGGLWWIVLGYDGIAAPERDGS